MILDSDAIINFWFRDDIDMAHNYKRWFNADRNFDQEIRAHFAQDLMAIKNGEQLEGLDQKRDNLAAIVLLDQFPRNAFRGTSDAFAFDEIALALCRRGLEQQQDETLAFVERVFFYLPLEHAEELAAQQTSLEKFRDLCAHAPEPLQSFAKRNLEFAQSHFDIIRQFGRFPHRNAVLGRASTPAERRFLNARPQPFGPT